MVRYKIGYARINPIPRLNQDWDLYSEFGVELPSENKPKTTNHKILVGDCRKSLKTLESNSVNLVVTSPPYNVGKAYGKWDDRIPYHEYIEFTKEWIRECHRVLVEGGMISGEYPHVCFAASRVSSHRHICRCLVHTDDKIKGCVKMRLITFRRENACQNRRIDGRILRCF